ncbi:hypothetical protein [Paralimibaculum aggregatum]|uniref:hypothetical protein n=1 Tax=Paralimibaculum aggregatum TaxID=3036245 RepID=UPI0025552DD3|nr:hypothetical protein [Limibaculum sp. NKW23]
MPLPEAQEDASIPDPGHANGRDICLRATCQTAPAPEHRRHDSGGPPPHARRWRGTARPSAAYCPEATFQAGLIERPDALP